MSHARQPMSPEDYLAWEARQEAKHEFDGVRPVAMGGATVAHNRIQGNLITALNIRLGAGRCQPSGPDIRVPTMPGRYRYPDALIVCTPQAAAATEIADPVVIFEILSDSTSGDDRAVKLSEYQAIPSLRHYVLLEQDRIFATLITRAERGWDLALVGPGGALAMPAVGIELLLQELYAGLALAGEASGPPAVV